MASYDDLIELPHSLKELQNWAKTHPTPKPMVRASDDPTSILYNERKIDMPQSLQELQEWSRTHRASGGSANNIENALRLAKKTLKIKRKHFDDGGADRDHQNETHETDTHESDSSDSRNATEKDFSDDRAAQDAAQSEKIAQAIADSEKGRGLPEGTATADVSKFGFGKDFNASDAANAGASDVSSPQDIREYTQQRLEHPYEGTLLSATMDPSTAFGMSYPDLVGKQLSPQGAEAFLGNLGYESTQGGQVFNPQAISGSGYGLAQWTDPTRQAAFFSAMTPEGQTVPQTPEEKRNLLASTTPQQQLGYALNEVFGGGYDPTARALTTPGSIADKISTITSNYEGAGVPALDARIKLANQIAKDQGYGQFAYSGFSPAPDASYAANIPMPMARPTDLNQPFGNTLVADNVPTPIARPSDLGGTMTRNQIMKALLSGVAQADRTKLASSTAYVPVASSGQYIPVSKSNYVAPAFTGSTEDPENTAIMEALIRSMRGYADGGSPHDHIGHALRLARKHFEDGGDSGGDSSGKDEGGDTTKTENTDNTDNVRADAYAQKLQNSVDNTSTSLADTPAENSVNDAVASLFGFKIPGQEDVSVSPSDKKYLADTSEAGQPSTEPTDPALRSILGLAPLDSTTVFADPYRALPVDSVEDPRMVAFYNNRTGDVMASRNDFDPSIVQYQLDSPRNAVADMALGQRTPMVMKPDGNGNMVPTFLSVINNAFEDLTNPFVPMYLPDGTLNPEYKKLNTDTRYNTNPDLTGLSLQPGYQPSTTTVGTKKQDATVTGTTGTTTTPATTTTTPTTAATTTTPTTGVVTPTTYVPTPVNAPTAYADFGASKSMNPYTNPALDKLLAAQKLKMGLPLASGGRAYGNDAVGNALRMAHWNKQ